MNVSSDIRGAFGGRVGPVPGGNRLLRIVCFAILMTVGGRPAGAGPPAPVPVEGIPVDGKPFDAELVAIGDDWQLQFGTAQNRRTLPAAELVRWGAFAETDRGPIVVMADGGLLVADVLRTEKQRLKVDSGSFGLVAVPLERLAGVVFDPPAGRRRRDLLLDRIVRAKGQADRLLLHNGDELTGLIEAVEDDTVRLRTDNGPLQIETQRIAGLVFNPLLRQRPAAGGLRAWVGLADGSRLAATRVVVDGASLQVTAAAGQTWKTSAKELVGLQPLGGRVTYLSDLEPADYVHVPYLDLRWPSFGTDRNVTGGRLRCDGRLYLKGLGVHSAARLTYRLDGSYTRFEAELGVDDSTSGGGSVRFRVFVDGREKHTSQTIRGGMAPVPVSVELEGAKRLDLVVDYAERADELDHADWLGARLVGKQ